MSDYEEVGVEWALGEQVAEALAPTEFRLKIEALRKRNDEILARLLQRGMAIQKADVMHVHLSVLVELLFGDMDQPARLTYEHAVQAKFAELLTDAEAQAARATLLNGVRIDPRNQRPPGQ